MVVAGRVCWGVGVGLEAIVGREGAERPPEDRVARGMLAGLGGVWRMGVVVLACVDAEEEVTLEAGGRWMGNMG